jgi:hypothetical protein
MSLSDPFGQHNRVSDRGMELAQEKGGWRNTIEIKIAKKIGILLFYKLELFSVLIPENRYLKLTKP